MRHAIALAAILLVSAGAFASDDPGADFNANDEDIETLRLSEVTREVEVAIQRGHSIPTGACALSLINEIKGYGGAESAQEFTITFGGYQIVITDGSLTHICDQGVHIWVDEFQTSVMQIWDENGEPTIMED